MPWTASLLCVKQLISLILVLRVTRPVRVESSLFSVSVFGPVVCSSLVSGAWALLSGSGSKTQLVRVIRLVL